MIFVQHRTLKASNKPPKRLRPIDYCTCVVEVETRLFATDHVAYCPKAAIIITAYSFSNSNILLIDNCLVVPVPRLIQRYWQHTAIQRTETGWYRHRCSSPSSGGVIIRVACCLLLSSTWADELGDTFGWRWRRHTILNTQFKYHMS